MMKWLGKSHKGFTLAELLIVVAIIAVLIAIAVPVFSGNIAKAKEAVDIENLHAAYAEAQNRILNGEMPPVGAAAIFFLGDDYQFQIRENWNPDTGVYKAEHLGVEVEIKRSDAGWLYIKHQISD